MKEQSECIKQLEREYQNLLGFDRAVAKEMIRLNIGNFKDKELLRWKLSKITLGDIATAIILVLMKATVVTALLIVLFR